MQNDMIINFGRIWSIIASSLAGGNAQNGCTELCTWKGIREGFYKQQKYVVVNLPTSRGKSLLSGPLAVSCSRPCIHLWYTKDSHFHSVVVVIRQVIALVKEQVRAQHWFRGVRHLVGWCGLLGLGTYQQVFRSLWGLGSRLSLARNATAQLANTYYTLCLYIDFHQIDRIWKTGDSTLFWKVISAKLVRDEGGGADLSTPPVFLTHWVS